jgi:hypothetical protein
LAYGLNILERRGRITPAVIKPTEAKKLGLHIRMTLEDYKKYAEHEMLGRLIEGHAGDTFSTHA